MFSYSESCRIVACRTEYGRAVRGPEGVGAAQLRDGLLGRGGAPMREAPLLWDPRQVEALDAFGEAARQR